MPGGWRAGSPRLHLLHRGARVAARAPVLAQLAALVERDLVAGQHVGRVRDPLELEDLDDDLPAVVAVLLEPEHALDAPPGQRRDLLDGAPCDVDRARGAVARGHLSSPPAVRAARPRGARTPPRTARRDRTRPPGTRARPVPVPARRGGARPPARPARRSTPRRGRARAAGSTGP